jgi:hypothetical protein
MGQGNARGMAVVNNPGATPNRFTSNGNWPTDGRLKYFATLRKPSQGFLEGPDLVGNDLERSNSG